MKDKEHPMQPLVQNAGHSRFKANEIVLTLFQMYGLDAINDDYLFSQEDWDQFWQLTGMSVDAYCKSDEVSEESKELTINMEKGYKTELEVKYETLLDNFNRIVAVWNDIQEGIHEVDRTILREHKWKYTN